MEYTMKEFARARERNNASAVCEGGEHLPNTASERRGNAERGWT